MPNDSGRKESKPVPCPECGSTAGAGQHDCLWELSDQSRARTESGFEARCGTCDTVSCGGPPCPEIGGGFNGNPELAGCPHDQTYSDKPAHPHWRGKHDACGTQSPQPVPDDHPLSKFADAAFKAAEKLLDQRDRLCDTLSDIRRELRAKPTQLSALEWRCLALADDALEAIANDR